MAQSALFEQIHVCRGCDLSGITLVGDYHLSDVSASDLTGSDLTGADLSKLFDGADLTGVHAAGIDMSDAIGRPSERGDPGSHTGPGLVGSDFAAANLQNLILRWADLSSATLAGADLRAAGFEHVEAVGADFSDAILTGLTWEGGDLSDADLSDADLSGAVGYDRDQFFDVLIVNTTCPDGSIASGPPCA
jgi:uncharacterized protein YjbI with pentapeptide repeats